MAEQICVKASVLDDDSFDELSKPQRHSIVLKNSELSLTQKEYSKSELLKARVLWVIRKERRCCCACCKLFADEIATNNQIYNLVKGTSSLVSPTVRLSLLFLALLFEFFLNALFYNLNPSEEETPLLWEGITENIWVSVYSFLFAMIPLLLLGLTFSSSSQTRKKLKRAENPQHLKRIYSRLKKRIRCNSVGGLIFFLLIANFLLLYIVCFCHVATQRMSQDWFRSSLILAFLDLIILEILPGILFAILGLFYSFCS